MAVVLVIAYFILAAFLPRWWAQRIASLANGSFSAGIAWGLLFGLVCGPYLLNIINRPMARELQLAELWALPTTLRVVLIENLRRLAERVATHKAARELANLCSDRLHTFSIDSLDELLGDLDRRGVGQSDHSPSVEPGVGIYINDGGPTKMQYFLKYDAAVFARSCAGGRQDISGSIE